jgi:hypothetical protein
MLMRASVCDTSGDFFNVQLSSTAFSATVSPIVDGRRLSKLGSRRYSVPIAHAPVAGLIAAGLLSVTLFAVSGLALPRRGDASGAPPRDTSAMPTPAMPVLSVEDRALCRAAPR